MKHSFITTARAYYTVSRPNSPPRLIDNGRMWEQKGRGDAADAADEDEHGRERRYEQYNQHSNTGNPGETARAANVAANTRGANSWT